MNVDLRAFRYALEPVRRQRAWQLDAVRARHAQLRREIDDASAVLEAQRAEYRSQCARASSGGAHMLDPVARRHMLAWLGHSQARLARTEQALTALHDECRRAAGQCIEAEQRLRVIERHRSHSLAQFVRREAARLGSEADRDWLARAESVEASSVDEQQAMSMEHGE